MYLNRHLLSNSSQMAVPSCSPRPRPVSPTSPYTLSSTGCAGSLGQRSSSTRSAPRKLLRCVSTTKLWDILIIRLSSVQWLARVTAHLQSLKSSLPKPTLLKGAEAADTIIRDAHEAYDVAGFDDVEAQRLGVQRGATVKVAPEDSGEWYTHRRVLDA
jgi:hypothetical protein